MILHATDSQGRSLYIHPRSGAIVLRDTPMSNGHIPMRHQNFIENHQTREELYAIHGKITAAFIDLCKQGGGDLETPLTLEYSTQPVPPEPTREKWLVADFVEEYGDHTGSWIVHTHRPIFCQFVPDETEDAPPPPVVAEGHYLPDDSPLRSEALAEYIRLTPIG